MKMARQIKIQQILSFYKQLEQKSSIEITKGAKLLSVKAFPDGVHAILEQDSTQEEKETVNFYSLPPEGDLPENLNLTYLDTVSFVSSSEGNYGVIVLHIYKIND